MSTRTKWFLAIVGVELFGGMLMSARDAVGADSILGIAIYGVLLVVGGCFWLVMLSVFARWLYRYAKRVYDNVADFQSNRRLDRATRKLFELTDRLIAVESHES